MLCNISKDLLLLEILGPCYFLILFFVVATPMDISISNVNIYQINFQKTTNSTTFLNIKKICKYQSKKNANNILKTQHILTIFIQKFMIKFEVTQKVNMVSCIAATTGHDNRIFLEIQEQNSGKNFDDISFAEKQPELQSWPSYSQTL